MPPRGLQGGFFTAPGAILGADRAETPVTEDERLQLLGTVSEAHAGIREAALRLRRLLPAKSAALKAALRAESGVFRLKRELQRMDLAEPARRHGALPEVRRGGKAVDVGRLRPRKSPGEEP